MKEIRTEIEIAASAARVWSILADFRAFPSWNPFLAVEEPAPIQGARITVTISPVGRRPMTFRPTVETAAPSQELRWIGHLGARGLFDGRHRFEIVPLGPDRVRFVHSERFGGILAGLVMGRGMTEATRAGFERMNAALRARAEPAASSAPTT